MLCTWLCMTVRTCIHPKMVNYIAFINRLPYMYVTPLQKLPLQRPTRLTTVSQTF